MRRTALVVRRQREMVHAIAKEQSAKGRLLALKYFRKFNERANQNRKGIEG